MEVRIVEVKLKNEICKFLDFPAYLYKNEKSWIRPWDKDIEAVFEPLKNKYFNHGECIRWIAQTENGETVGKIAAFINHRTAFNDKELAVGGIGFFDSVNNTEVAFALFDTAKNWLQHRKMKAMDGPINFGERDRWWGLLVNGFSEPNYCMNYNFPYYRQLFENYGFKNYFEQYTYVKNIADDLAPKFYEKASQILNNPDYSFCHFDMKQTEKFADDFRTIYNLAWVGHQGVSTMQKEQSMAIMRALKPIIDPEIIWFGYFKNQPIAFFISIPEINQIIKYLNGKYNFFTKLKFWYLQKKGVCRKCFGVIFGVIPEHQKKGVEAAIVVEFAKLANVSNYRYESMEMNWIGDFNPKMMRVVESIGAKICKTHITYRKLFDENREFERMKSIE